MACAHAAKLSEFCDEWKDVKGVTPLFDNYRVEFDWEETWSYGGHEHHNVSFLVDDMFNSDEVIAKLKLESGLKKKRASEAQAEKILQSEIAELKRLREKHPDAQ